MKGPIEEAGEVAKGAVNALKGFPALLTLSICQLLTLGAIAWSVHERNLSTDSVIKQLIERCGRAAGLL